jgi:hypothetical protein
MSSDEKISSNILSNVDIIAYIYGIVQYAGLKATQSKEVQTSKNNVCVIKPNIPGQNRVTTDCIKTTSYEIDYDSNDIMIVGGAALNIYDYKLKEFKTRRKLGTLEDYIKKKTSDIDIVWWPRPDTDKEIITSKSEAIVTLVNIFKDELIQEFSKNRENLERKIRPFITNASNSDKLRIDISSFHTWKAGVFNISIIFQIKNIVLKICDIVVHDSGSSQRFDVDGKEITDLRFMIDDPVYCAPDPIYSNGIIQLNVNGTNIAVPNIWSFVEQQMFAFDNLVRTMQIKSFINYKRVEFIKKLLLSFKLNNISNKQNYKNLIEVLKTDNLEYITLLINEINTRVYESIYKENSYINNLCSTVNVSSDSIINELCYKSKLLSQIPMIVVAEIENLERIKDRIIQKSRQVESTTFKTEYNKLIGEIIKLQENLKGMAPIEILKTQHLQEKPSTLIQKKEKEINDTSRVWKNKRDTNIKRNRETRKASIMRYPSIQPPPPLPPPPPNYYQQYPYYQQPTQPPLLSSEPSMYYSQSQYPQSQYPQSYYRGRGRGRGIGRNNKTYKTHRK